MIAPRTWMSVLVALAACGCGGRTHLDLLETRLRQQEDALYRTRSELTAAQDELQAARQESESLRSQLVKGGPAAMLPEVVATQFRATDIQVNKLLTGGLDRDGRPGDDALNVAVTPVDADGEPVKLPGVVRVELFDLAQPESRQRIGEWEFTAAQAAEQWRSNFLGSGYRFQVPWKTAPTHADLLVHARFVTADGRQFDTSQTVRITPPAAAGPLADQPPPSAPPVEETTTAGSPGGQPMIRQASAEQPAPQPLELIPASQGDRKPDQGDRPPDIERLWQSAPPAAADKPASLPERFPSVPPPPGRASLDGPPADDGFDWRTDD